MSGSPMVIHHKDGVPPWVKHGHHHRGITISVAECHTIGVALQQRMVKQRARELAVALLNRVWQTGDGASQMAGFTLTHRPSGQPVGEHPLLGEYAVSISHSHSWYAGATSDTAVGIDLQQYRTFGTTAWRYAFAAGEQHWGRVQACAAWAIREAFLKSHGCGLPYRLRDIRIDWNNALVSHPGQLECRQFWLWYSLDWVCALCFPLQGSLMTDMDIVVVPSGSIERQGESHHGE